MATYQITDGSVSSANGITSFEITWTKDDGTKVGPHAHSVESTDEATIYAALDLSAAALEKASGAEKAPALTTGQALTVGAKVAELSTPQ